MAGKRGWVVAVWSVFFIWLGGWISDRAGPLGWPFSIIGCLGLLSLIFYGLSGYAKRKREGR